MKAELENLPLVKNDEASRFELTVDGYTAIIDYKERNKVIFLIHTESPAKLAGRGVATALIEKTLVFLAENAYTIVPLCPMVVAYIKKHPEYIQYVREDHKPNFE